MSGDLLKLVLLLFAKKRRIKGGITSLWSGAGSLLRPLLSLQLQLRDTPPPTRLPISHYVQQRGQYLLHPELDPDTLIYLAKFQSFVPLHSVVSPARLAALFVCARLFPTAWRAMSTAAFADRIVLSIDRYNACFSEPTMHELIEIAGLFSMYCRWKGGRSDIGAELLGMAGQGSAAFAFFSVVKTALSDETARLFVDSLRQFYFVTHRSWRAFSAEFDRLPLVNAASVIASFSFTSSPASGSR
jgi:hypothetical protein